MDFEGTTKASRSPLAACLAASVTSGTQARRMLYEHATEKRVTIDGRVEIRKKIPQFPCMLNETGTLRMSSTYMASIQNTTPLPLSWMHGDTPLLSKASLMKRLGIFVHKDSKVIKNSSHGEVWFGTIGPTPGAGIPVAIKFMPVKIDDDGYERAMPFQAANSAYVDPFISWMGSELVTRQESCAFAQLYGTFVCRGVVGDGGRRSGAPVPVPVPLVAMVSEELGVKLDEVIIRYLQPGKVQWEKLVAVIAQAMVALAQAHAMSFVHNDAHMGNFLVAKTCPSTTRKIYYNINDTLFKVPAEHRVVLMDFGRSTVSELDCREGTCKSRPVGVHASGRIQASEVHHRFSEWELNDPSADVTHFFAMLLLCQETPDLLLKESSRPDAPPIAKALVAFMRRVLVCGSTGKDMFTAYNVCNNEELHGQATGNPTSCGKDLVHELRAKDSRCGNVLPIDFLTNRDIMEHFRAREPIPPPPEGVLYLPSPPSLADIHKMPSASASASDSDSDSNLAFRLQRAGHTLASASSDVSPVPSLVSGRRTDATRVKGTGATRSRV